MISQTNVHTILPKAIIVSFILGFNGFSIQAQVSSIIAKTDIRFTPYFVSRILHGSFASLLTILLFKPLYLDRQVLNVEDIPVIQDITDNHWLTFLNYLKQTGPFITIIFIAIASIIMYRRIRKKDVESIS